MTEERRGEMAVSWTDLVVWKKAHALTLRVVREVQGYSWVQMKVVGNQLLRAIASVPANIAEGKGRNSPAEFRQFLVIARGSLEESRYFVLLARDLRWLEAERYDEFETRMTEVSKLLNALIRTLRPPT